MSRRDLMDALSINKKTRFSFLKTINKLTKEGLLRENKGQYFLQKGKNTVEAEIVKLAGNFGFARSTKEEENQEYFIPGRDLRGALLGDKVLISFRKSSGNLPDGRVLKVLEEGNSDFSGVLRRGDSGYFIEPDHIGVPFRVVKGGLMGAKEGEKVRAVVENRGKSHRDHQVRVVVRYGDSDSAKNCAEAILADHDVIKEFPAEVKVEAAKIPQFIPEKELLGRTDLRNTLIFTIDAEESKDLDDAISLEVKEKGYLLGVHIADVSHYVQPKQPIDAEAYKRGTSVYYADQVVPMLPKLLSNGICSLNPNEDRLAFTAWMELSQEGDLLSYKFEKSVICSSVKGIYKEINAIYEDSAEEEVKEKYKLLIPTLQEMKLLAEKRMKLRQGRGGFDLDSSESKIIVNKDGKAVDVIRRERGFSEKMIEEFMLLANEAAACFGKEKNLPFIYRVHEEPAADRIADLSETLKILGISEKNYDGVLSQKEIQRLLKKVEGTPFQEALHYRILRTMAKARYQSEPIGHYGLILKDYTHFTSPIRRYPDLVIHRIMSEAISGKINQEALHKKYDRFVVQASKHSSDREVAAMNVERDCEDCYKAEYIRPYVGDVLETEITAFAPHAIYLSMKNTVEGRMDFKELPMGKYELDGNVRLRETMSNKVFNIGTPMRCVLLRADVSTGQIDFAPEENGRPKEPKEPKRERGKSKANLSRKGKAIPKNKINKEKKKRTEK